MEPRPLIHLTFDDELSVYIEAYLDDLELARRSPRTIEFYRGNLERFAYWLRTNDGPGRVERISSRHIRSFLRYVQTTDARWDSEHAKALRPVGDSTVNAYHRSLRAWFNWLVGQEHIEQSPVTRVPAPSVPKDQPDPLSETELGRISEVLRGGAHLRSPNPSLMLRDRAIFATMLDTGVRVSELVNLGISTEQLNLVTGEMLIVSGKGNKSRRVRLGAAGRRVLRLYWTRFRVGQSDACHALFLNARGNQLTSNGVGQMMRKVGAAAEVERLHPHRLRHTCAIYAVRAGMPLFQLQVMLGHESLEMVRRYAKVAEADVMKAMQEHSPLDRLDLRL